MYVLQAQILKKSLLPQDFSPCLPPSLATHILLNPLPSLASQPQPSFLPARSFSKERARQINLEIISEPGREQGDPAEKKRI